MHAPLIISFFLIAQACYSQQWDWIKSPYSKNFSKYVFAMTTDSEGNAIIAGFHGDSLLDFEDTVTQSNGGTDAFIAKYDPAGETVWAKSIGGTTTEVGQSVATDESGNVYLGGECYDTGFTISGDSIKKKSVFIIKFGPDGDYKWSRSYPVTALSSVDAMCAKNGKLYAAINFSGKLSLQTPYNSSGWNDFCLLALDTGGTELWAGKYGGYYDEKITNMKTDAFGDVVVCGTVKSQQLIVGSDTLYNNGDVHYSCNSFIIRFSDEGDPLWSRLVSGISHSDETVSALEVDNAGNIYAGGYCESYKLVYNKTDTLNSLGIGGGGFLFKIDKNGSKLWLSSSRKTAIYSVGKTDSGIFIAGGFSENTQIGTYSITCKGGSDIFLARLNENGVPNLAMTIGGENSEYHAKISASSDAIYLSGNFQSNTLETSGFFLLNTDKENATDCFVSKILLQPSEVGITETDHQEKMRIYPNPASDRIKTTSKSVSYHVQILSMTGEEVFSGTCHGSESSLNVSSVPEGCYIMKITGEDFTESSVIVILR